MICAYFVRYCKYDIFQGEMAKNVAQRLLENVDRCISPAKVFHFSKYGKTLKNQVMHKVIHIIHMEKHVDELIYIMGIETNVLVIVMKM